MIDAKFMPELQMLGRFVRARRLAASIADYPQLPLRRRHRKHLSQEDLARIVGVSTVVISQIEQGRYPNTNASLLSRIADTLNLSYLQRAYLLGLADPRPEKQIGIESPPAWVQESIANIQHPTVVLTAAFDIVAANGIAQTFFEGYGGESIVKQNAVLLSLRAIHAGPMLQDWEPWAQEQLANLRVSYATHPAYRDRIEAVVRQLAEDERLLNIWEHDDLNPQPSLLQQLAHSEIGTVCMYRILTDLWGLNGLTRVEYVPADDASRAKLDRMRQRLER